jgi:methyl-accepting chemotaxis protein
MIAGVSRGMSEQAAAATQVATAVENMRKQADQAARAMAEQSRAMSQLTVGTQNINKQIKLIAGANKDHSAGAGRLRDQLKSVRAVTERNVRGVQETRSGTAELIGHLATLTGELDGRASSSARQGSNGRRA